MSALNQARASLGLPAYLLPNDFDSLSPPEQLLVLTDADRAAYGLATIPGLTDQLDQDANGGVQADADPSPSSGSWMAYTSNWAGGYVNVVLAYFGWMYDDGPGSGNQDCTPADPSGCWGHRHDVLWQFDPGGGPTAMGAAAGSYAAGTPSYAMLLVQGSDSAYYPAYSYTWNQAVSAGANGGVGSAGSSGASGAASSGTDPGGATTGSSSSVSATGSSATSTGPPVGSGTGETGSGPSMHAARSGREPGAHIATGPVAIERVREHSHRIRLRLAVSPGLRVVCSLLQWSGREWRIERSKGCSARTVFRYVPRGHYSLRVSSAAGTVARRVVVR